MIDPYREYVVLYLPMNGENGSTTFTDYSLEAKTPTVYGNSSISTSIYKYNGSSGYFDGTGDYLSFDASSTFNLYQLNFTIEFWVYATGSGNRHICGYNNTGASWWDIALNSSNQIFVRLNSNTTTLTSTISILNNTWTHVAVVCSSNVTTIYINGKNSGYTANSFTGGNGNYVLGICVNLYGGIYYSYFSGYLQELRITKGIARYTTNFYPPTASFLPCYTKTYYDPYFERTTLLLKMEGSNNGTTFLDSSLNPSITTIVPTGEVKTVTAQSKFGATSTYFDGSGDYLTINPASIFNFASSDFTIEMWFYPTDATRRALFAFSSDFSLGLDYHYQGTRNINLWASSNGSTWNMIVSDSGGNGIGTLSLNLNAWNHVAMTRSGNTFRSFVNGVLDKSVTVSGSIYTSGRTLRVGIWGSVGTPLPLLGYIDNFRVTQGYARYTSTFIPQTTAFSSNVQPKGDLYFYKTQLLLHGNGSEGGTTFTDSSQNNLTVSSVGNVQTSLTQSKYGGSSIYFDGSGDGLSANNALVALGSGDFTIEAWVYFVSFTMTYSPICDFRPS